MAACPHGVLTVGEGTTHTTREPSVRRLQLATGHDPNSSVEIGPPFFLVVCARVSRVLCEQSRTSGLNIPSPPFTLSSDWQISCGHNNSHKASRRRLKRHFLTISFLQRETYITWSRFGFRQVSHFLLQPRKQSQISDTGCGAKRRDATHCRVTNTFA